MTRRSGSGPRPTKGRPAGSTTDQRLLDSSGQGDWVHTDPWRVMKIQAEFVEGVPRWLATATRRKGQLELSVLAGLRPAAQCLLHRPPLPG